MEPIVYLDSCDFSDLSEVDEKISDENRETLSTLRSSARKGRARFVLSGIHLAEAVHATETPAHKEAAVRRAGLMQELCANNFMRLPHEIMSLEIAKAINGAADAKLSNEELFSKENEWFGISIPIDFSQKRSDANASLDRLMSHLPRRERRRFKSDLSLHKARGREKWREFARNDTSPLSDEFPFNQFTGKFVTEWISGHITDEEYSNRLYEALNNPKGLVESVLDFSDQRQTIYGLLRNQGRDMQLRMDENLQEMIDNLAELATPELDFDFSKFFRQALQKVGFQRTIVSAYSISKIDSYTDKEIAQFVTACPAVSTFLNMYIAYSRSRYESTWQRIKSGKRTPTTRKASDLGDMMHAVYAPYSNLFRCDAHFSSILKEDQNVRSRIVSRRGLNALANPIEGQGI